jgi:hypothetical protein
MAKTRAPKKPETLPEGILDPKRVHELLRIPGPYDEQELPIPTKGFTTFWDPGCSIVTLLHKARDLFDRMNAWYEKEAFAKLSDSWRWRMVRLDAADPGKPFEEQRQAVTIGDPPLARELVTYLVIQALATGSRPEIRKLRCRDTLPSGRRVYVGNFGSFGLEIGNVGDRWSSPGISLAASLTPVVKKK